MEKPWILAYEPKEWAIYMVPFSSPDKEAFDASLKKLEDAELLVCAGESEAAEDHWKRNGSVKNVLFCDIEQLWAMDFDKFYGVSDVGVLIKEWKGHQSGSLVMSIFRGASEEPPCFTICVVRE